LAHLLLKYVTQANWKRFFDELGKLQLFACEGSDTAISR
jgi:hypothetical protein